MSLLKTMTDALLYSTLQVCFTPRSSPLLLLLIRQPEIAALETMGERLVVEAGSFGLAAINPPRQLFEEQP